MDPQAAPITPQLHALGEWLLPAARALPPAVVARARRLWTDTVACACAGLRSEELVRWVAAQSHGDAGTIPLPGSAAQLGAAAATGTFAIAACWDEACEGLALAHGRPGVPVVAALWPRLADGYGWDAIWRATAIGYEVGARLGARLRIRTGMHVDGVWGAFGAAAACVSLEGGGWQDIARALEACATQLPFSLYRPVREGANVRNLYLGHSAWLGVQAAHAVRAGMATPQGAIDDFATLALAGAPAGTWPAPGEWLLLQSYWKRFAAVRHVHYGAQAALALRHSIEDVEAIESIRLTTYPEALHYCGNRAPATVLAAQFSLSFGIAAALVHGDLSPAEFRAPRFDDPRVRRLEGLVEIVADDQAFAHDARGARLSAHCGGRVFEVEQGALAGDGGAPSAEEVHAKFDAFTRGDAALAAWARRLESAASGTPAHFPDSGGTR